MFNFILKTLKIISGWYCSFWFSSSALSILGQCGWQVIVSKKSGFPTWYWNCSNFMQIMAHVSITFDMRWRKYKQSSTTYKAQLIFSKDPSSQLISKSFVVFCPETHFDPWMLRKELRLDFLELDNEILLEETKTSEIWIELCSDLCRQAKQCFLAHYGTNARIRKRTCPFFLFGPCYPQLAYVQKNGNIQLS